jgi:hypothetical protein
MDAFNIQKADWIEVKRSLRLMSIFKFDPISLVPAVNVKNQYSITKPSGALKVTSFNFLSSGGI